MHGICYVFKAFASYIIFEACLAFAAFARSDACVTNVLEACIALAEYVAFTAFVACISIVFEACVAFAKKQYAYYTYINTDIHC